MGNLLSIAANTARKSEIVFVSPKTFKKVCEKLYTNGGEYIGHWDIKPVFGGREWLGYRTNIPGGFTDGVKTCAAGVVSTPNKATNCIWHLNNTSSNFQNLKEIEPLLEGSHAVLVGAKRIFKGSAEFFNKITKSLKEKKIPTTIFRGIHMDWEASLAHSSATDTVYLSINKIGNKHKFVHSRKKLKKICNTIEISPENEVKFPGIIRQLFLPQKVH